LPIETFVQIFKEDILNFQIISPRAKIHKVGAKSFACCFSTKLKSFKIREREREREREKERERERERESKSLKTLIESIKYNLSI